MTTPSQNLDFDSIKSSIVDFIKSDPTFTDYNFEGSALNTLVNILAYNTFNNAFLASASHAEKFIDSAQKRASVVSRGTEMGYTPRSANCAIAYVDIEALGAPGVAILPKGTQFTSSNENGSFVFSVRESVTSEAMTEGQRFLNVPLIEGTLTTNYFKVNTLTNPRGVFTIPNDNIDTTTLKVYVRDSLGAVDRTEYTLAENVYEITRDSTSFFLTESYDGFFQIMFGGNIIGKQPVDGAIVDIEYFVTNNYSLSNGCKLFAFNGSNITADSINIITTQVAFGGDLREAIDSIKINAVKSNSAKNRSVSAADYELSIKELFNFAKTVSVWGGEDNVPPIYGKVFASIQPISGFVISDAIKRDVIVPALRKNNVMTVIPEIVDPEYLLIDCLTSVKYNPTKTTYTKSEIETLVRTKVTSYVESISKFNTDFLESVLTGQIATVPGVVSSSIDTRVGFRMSPLIGLETSYTRSVNNAIKQGTISSTKFRTIFGGVSTLVSIKEIVSQSRTILVSGVNQTVQDLGLFNETGEMIIQIGEVNLTTGKFTIAYTVNAYITGNRFVSVSCELVNDDIKTMRNQIITFDNTSADSAIGLLSNNRVVAEQYNK